MKIDPNRVITPLSNVLRKFDLKRVLILLSVILWIFVSTNCFFFVNWIHPTNQHYTYTDFIQHELVEGWKTGFILLPIVIICLDILTTLVLFIGYLILVIPIKLFHWLLGNNLREDDNVLIPSKWQWR